MKIDTDKFTYIREAEYEQEVDMLRLVIVCTPNDIEFERVDREMLNVKEIVERSR